MSKGQADQSFNKVLYSYEKHFGIQNATRMAHKRNKPNNTEIQCFPFPTSHTLLTSEQNNAGVG